MVDKQISEKVQQNSAPLEPVDAADQWHRTTILRHLQIIRLRRRVGVDARMAEILAPMVFGVLR